MKSKRVIGAIITIIFFIIGIYMLFKNIEVKKIENEYQDYTPQEEISDVQSRQTKILLYFENIETKNLEAETQIIDANLLIENPYKKLIEFLIKGPQSTKLKKLIPDGTVVYDVKVKNSCAEINVSNQFLEFGDEKNKLKIIIFICSLAFQQQ